MHKAKPTHSVLVIGSGPIIIGQAAEFDYAGSQACRTLKEAGKKVILVNNNPATFMTDPGLADRVYMEPLTVAYLTEIIRRERPDALLPSLGGQVGLNLARELANLGVLEDYQVELLGTPLSAIEKSEDRKLFKQAMAEIGQPVPKSAIAHSVAEAVQAADGIGYPVIVRPAYTLGGTGGGMADDEKALRAIAAQGLKYSPVSQVLIEQSIAGWKEIEYEVIRDGRGNAITICNMENFDPVGIHTGDSIVVAPCQTLSNAETQMLRSAALAIVDSLGIAGGCNVQFALHPGSKAYQVIEVNPRVSRSSALASKATGYPIAKVATLVSLGLGLDEITNAVTGTSACFEPALDYVVVKIPRWPFDKFSAANRSLGSQMKATGEVMAIGRSFESALMKAVRGMETRLGDLRLARLSVVPVDSLLGMIRRADDERIFALAELLRRGVAPEYIHNETLIDMFFLTKLANLIGWEQKLAADVELSSRDLRTAKQLGFSDASIAALRRTHETEIFRQRKNAGINPVYKMVDTCAGEFDALTPYFYSSYDREDEASPLEQESIVVIGSGPIRIGQGVEFDYCSVHASLAARAAGLCSIIINNNPETVSTDFDTSSRLYFEPLGAEDVLEILSKEQPKGVLVQFGGQTAINLAATIANAGFTILGTPATVIHACEDRRQFDALLEELDIPRPAGLTATSAEEAAVCAKALGFPVLVRPSFVLGGRSMAVVDSMAELDYFVGEAIMASPDHPILIDKYLQGKEFELDAVCDGESIFVPGIMEHVERAGIHSGDSFAIYPAPNLPHSHRDTMLEYCRRIAKRLGLVGMINAQFVIYEDKVYIIEVNPRASRTVPFISKVTGTNVISLAVKVMLGASLRDLGVTEEIGALPGTYAVKGPVFSFNKLMGAEIALGPEMKSTGETIGLATTLPGAMHKAFQGCGITLAQGGTVLLSVADRDKAELLPLARALESSGFALLASQGTRRYLMDQGLTVGDAAGEELLAAVEEGQVSLVVNTVTMGRHPEREGFKVRRAAIEHGVPCLTSLDTLAALISSLPASTDKLEVVALGDTFCSDGTDKCG
ncbi:MAG TPA: carbamoyl-phosphate synthase (glutamine-hydrolyzing) large subunit [Bacillota bacterium]|nr:carbamoyl-phosphate synthase (glutamine-hydrolyzing) large subunit [Bacillota bacterium]